MTDEIKPIKKKKSPRKSGQVKAGPQAAISEEVKVQEEGREPALAKEGSEHLQHGALYEGSIPLRFPLDVGDDSTIKEMLEKSGFADVVVSGSGSVRNFSGVWQRPDMDLPLTPGIKIKKASDASSEQATEPKPGASNEASAAIQAADFQATAEKSNQMEPWLHFRDNLIKTRIAPDLLARMDSKSSESNAEAAPANASRFNVIIEFNKNFPGGISTARLTLLSAYEKAKNSSLASIPPAYHIALAPGKPQDDDALVKAFEDGDELAKSKSMWTDNYVFARLSGDTIARLSDWTLLIPGGQNDPSSADKKIPLIYKIWHDHTIKGYVYTSARTVKCDAARLTFAASGKGIVWAVADTGIDSAHPHFQLLDTLKLAGLRHMDFTEDHDSEDASEAAALTDQEGHGTHVAGIIAGFTCRKDTDPCVASQVTKIKIKSQQLNGERAPTSIDYEYPEAIAGLARNCKLLSLKVLKKGAEGDLSNLLAAIGYIQKCNDNGRSLKIHGLNLSLGYPFDPEWFAAGQSPLCVEVDRLVRSGVCVVVAAGNAGYGSVRTFLGPSEQAAHLGTISDPGNASLAITVGSTHRERPHAYGVSYFSAKGPTADGRMKPDLIAPGERIVSCALMDQNSSQANEAPFKEESGTSMAAPHVSGAIAAFLSVRGEFKGKPEEVKDIIVNAATDLKRRKEFQGAGLLDLMRALQSV